MRCCFRQRPTRMRHVVLLESLLATQCSGVLPSLSCFFRSAPCIWRLPGQSEVPEVPDTAFLRQL